MNIYSICALIANCTQLLQWQIDRTDLASSHQNRNWVSDDALRPYMINPVLNYQAVPSDSASSTPESHIPECPQSTQWRIR